MPGLDGPQSLPLRGDDGVSFINPSRTDEFLLLLVKSPGSQGN
jgi:hypothetical protein